MNICFYTGKEVSPEIGGTERITASVAAGLSKYYGIKCYSIYTMKIPFEFEKYKFEETLFLKNHQKEYTQLINFLKCNHIDVLINQGAFDLCAFFRKVANEAGTKLITVHHFDPGYEEHFVTFHSLLSQIKKKKDPLRKIWNIAKIPYFPIKKMKYVRGVPATYKEAYEYSDRVVLLSKNFKDDFLTYGRIKNAGNKIRVVPNCLSFDVFFDINKYSSKEKVVLIVSRLDEVQKRISLALKIWKDLCSNGNYNDWKLLIVGHGDYEGEYKSYVQRNNLKNVFFEGTQKPQSYYERASIFMLTSSHEGWGLTLTEAQQFGCVPLAFNSYKSLSDIITDGQNGYIIQDLDMETYKRRMQSLMDNTNLRKEMASHAIEDAKRYTPLVVCKRWYEILKDLMAHEVLEID